MPAALAAMIDERRDEQAAARAADTPPIALPAKSWRDIQARATTLGAQAELSDDGSQVRINADLPPAGLSGPRWPSNGRRCAGSHHYGQGLVEYGIVLGLSALVIVILLVFFDDQVAAVLDWLSNQLP